MKLSQLKIKIVPLLKEAGVTRSAVFGSIARGDAKKTSDVDLLVKMKKSSTLLDFITLKQKLEKKLGKKVDLLTFSSIDPKLKNYIEKDSIDIL